ncbi:MAG: hypothetical protein ACRD9R_22835 [Pyrinomonadaceae bacterium]
MSPRRIGRDLVALVFVIILGASSQALGKQKKSEVKKPLPKGTPVLWQEPSDLESRDLFWGPGGRAMRPDLRRVTFIKDQKGGFTTKYRVRDASGREWVAKIGKEAQSETAATRLLWAAGYFPEVTYLAPSVNIRGKGTFENVRFEARSKDVKRFDEWAWEDNPFMGTRELQGLKVVMVLLNNWDIKDENNVIIYAPEGGGQLRYAISDLGATFGKAGGLFWQLTRSRNKPEDFADAKFIEGVKEGYVDFSYGGKMPELFEEITVEQARWIGGYLARLSDQQLNDAFRAANYTPAEVRLLTLAVRARINELSGLAGETARP